MKSTEARYFLAIIPPSPLAEEVVGVKKLFAEKYNSKAALRSPAHLTLHMPFLWKERNEEKLIQKLEQAVDFESFQLKLNGFGAFPPRTIFIKNEYSEVLMSLEKELTAFTKRELKLLNSTHNRGFHPHITVAFRDLKPDQFTLAWQAFEHRPFDAEFAVNSFWLLKHDGKVWQAHKEFFSRFADNTP
ncbi:2'-5' RNA ligase family protein [Roseivirga pacifica]|uniref:2'-5' RNA ligase family protein n=1 Tax=Roseivirga pacifica TaxID=1267423 RepID=UPI00227C1206